MINTSTLPGYVGYGIRGGKGENGKEGISFHYTPYTIYTSSQTSLNVDDMNAELLNKLNNNLKISSINSFEPLGDGRTYKSNDIICDNEGKIFYYLKESGSLVSISGDNDIIKKFNLKSIYKYTDYFSDTNYNRLYNNAVSSLANIQSENSIYINDLPSIYNANIANFNNCIINTIPSNNTYLNKVYSNDKSQLCVRSVDNTFSIGAINVDALCIDVSKLYIPTDTFIGNNKIGVGETITNSLNNFLPEFISSPAFNIIKESGYYTINFNPMLFFKNGQIKAKNITMDVTVFNKSMAYPGITASTMTNRYIVKGINFLDTSQYSKVKISPMATPGHIHCMFITLYDEDTSMKVISNIRTFQ